MEDYFNFVVVNGRQPQYLFKWKPPQFFLQGNVGIASLASPELGTAQPQIVCIHICYKIHYSSHTGG